MNFRKDNRFDVVMEHSEAVEYVNDFGNEAFMDVMREEFPNYDLGSMSIHWERDSKYICKMKGTRGDIIIGWE